MKSRPIPPKHLLTVTGRSEWRAWLRKHRKTRTEIWLVNYKKHTGRQRLSYNDAVEEALCFGWIDSTLRTIDADRFAQRYSPRRAGSTYSQANQVRLRSLLARGKVAADVARSLPDLEEPVAVPPDILEAVRASRRAWKHFRTFSASYVRIRVGFIAAARRRPAEFRKRLAYFIRMTEQGKQFGHGGIDAHYGPL